MKNVIQLDNVCFSYGEQEVLHNISFEINPSSFVCIVGPNGGGKTTLLRLMLGLEKAGRGKISVFGMNPQKARTLIGYVMQHMHYDPNFPATVLDIVLMGLIARRPFGMFSAQEKKRARESLSQVGIENLALRPFSSLSGGQRQRALVAQALVAEPKLLVLDEPTANIDTDGEAAINNLLRDLASKVTVVMVSHNINTVLDCATHIICVNRTAVSNAINRLNPEALKNLKGGSMALLHHELSCQIFDKQTGGSCEPDDKKGKEDNH